MIYYSHTCVCSYITDTCTNTGLQALNFHDCVHNYAHAGVDHSTFGLGLIPEGLTEVRYAPDAWHYQSAETLGGLSYGGEFETYDAGGFTVELDLNQNISEAMIDELIQNAWMDRQTRAVFLEFTVYNPNVNSFGYTQLLAEVSQYGGMVTSSHIDLFRVYAIGLNGIYTYVCMGCFVFFFIYHLVVLIVHLVKTKCSREFWVANLLDVSILLLSIYLSVFYGLRYAETERVTALYRQDITKFVQFGYVAMYDARYKDGWAFLVCMITIKLCLLLRLNKRLSRLGYTLRHMVAPMLNYMFPSAFIYVAFTALACLMYMGNLFEFRTFNRTALTMFSFAMGSFDFLSSMTEVTELFTMVYFLGYMLFINLVIVNVMVAVIMDSHDTFKEAETLSAKDYELIAVIKKDVTSFVAKSIKMAET